MRLILHAGAHKTGTSTIQRALFENRGWLRARGIFYPDPRPRFGSRFRAHHALAHALARVYTGSSETRWPPIGSSRTSGPKSAKETRGAER